MRRKPHPQNETGSHTHRMRTIPARTLVPPTPKGSKAAEKLVLFHVTLQPPVLQVKWYRHCLAQSQTLLQDVSTPWFHTVLRPRQWSLSNTDTLGIKIIVLISEVSLFQGEKDLYLYKVGTQPGVLINQLSLFQRCPLREVPLYSSFPARGG